MVMTRGQFKVRLIFAFIVFFHQLSFAKIEKILGDTDLQKNPNLATPVPNTEASEIILSRQQYVISYNKLNRTPNWVAWKLELNQMGSIGRTNSFAVDTELENYLSLTHESKHAVLPNEYSGSCFDRGHQTPSADRTDNVINNQVTFLMSNMVPQTPYLNRVIWEHLERYTRQYVIKNNKKAFIIAGPIYDEDFGKIGPDSDIKVPSKEFKIIFFLDANQTASEINSSTEMIAVIMPNTLEDGTNPTLKANNCSAFTIKIPPASTDWMKYKSTLKEIEQQAKISFFN